MNPTLLRLALGGNALFSASCGLILVSATEPLTAVIGDVDPWILRLLGIGLLLFAAFLFWNAWRPTPHPVFALLITGADLGWVAGSVVLMLIPSTPLSASGTGVVAGVACVVLVFALLQVAGLWALTRNRGGDTTARSAFSITQRVDAPPEVVWNLVRDLERIGEFSPSIQSVEVTGVQGGARRTCENRSGQRWSEDVIEWDDQARILTLRFDAEAPDFPLPLEKMYGGWTIESAGDCADVTVWYEYTMRGGVVGEILAPLIAHQIRDMMTTTISNMEAESKQMAGIMAGT
ncbi:MAG: hypothetical protein GVY25_09885 [Bacteroidetes bacterium]|jgi:ribosome-associated toxin RatA of RatAB toxin-antitoxin module|nr:hypothetical protein [Bacteroidota bacterium]